MANPVSVLPSNFHSLMWGLSVLVAIIIVARVWLAVAYRGRSGSAVASVPWDVTVMQRPILTICEAKFFRVLQDAIGLQYSIFPQLSLWTMIDTSAQSRRTATAFRNRINLKRVDFVLVDPATFKPYMVIELDDSSHEREDRMKRDALVASALDRAGIKLVRIRVSAMYNPHRLRNQLGLTIPQERSA